ncbi:MAG: M28 family peptidase [Edaphobacter sp.]
MHALTTPRALCLTLTASTLLTIAATAQPQQKPDAATAAWWAQTKALSNDSMEGRDTGTEAYQRAANYVAAQFKAAGLKPAGDLLDGKATYFQRVPMHETDLDMAHSSVEIVTPNGGTLHSAPLKLLEEITIAPHQLIKDNANTKMVFLGYGLELPQTRDAKEFQGATAVIFNNVPAGLQSADRAAFARRRSELIAKAGFGSILSIDNPAAIEPTHWPAAYARSVVLAPAPSPNLHALLQLRISAEAAAKLFAADPDHPFAGILRDGEKGLPLPSFRLHSNLKIEAQTIEKEISSPNVIAILPGSDPKLAPEYVALSAHLDGYGYGTPVLGDNLYNGTLDDAAYVALLIEVAKDLQHKAPARSLLFCIFTGEEKGLLGSAWFTQHPTVPKENIVANLNLDQLRPIFPLNILTMEGLNDSTLGETARTVAAQFKIEIRPDLEPERNLFRRADNYSFVRIGVPIAAFVFGYDKGSPEEVVYRDWYARRYHKPQDDIKTPIDWAAAGKFNRFYTALALNIANSPTRPQWLSSSPYSPHQNKAH